MYLLVSTTVDSRQAAEALAAAVLDQRLAACIQINGPMTSMYRWQGKQERAEEWRLGMKTRAARYSALERLLLDRHPYDCPEIVATVIERGSASYLQWLDEEVGDGRSREG